MGSSWNLYWQLADCTFAVKHETGCKLLKTLSRETQKYESYPANDSMSVSIPLVLYFHPYNNALLKKKTQLLRF